VAREHLETVQVVQLAVLVRQHPVVADRRLGQEVGHLLNSMVAVRSWALTKLVMMSRWSAR